MKMFSFVTRLAYALTLEGGDLRKRNWIKPAETSTTSLMMALKSEMSDWTAQVKVWKTEAKCWKIAEKATEIAWEKDAHGGWSQFSSLQMLVCGNDCQGSTFKFTACESRYEHFHGLH